MQVDVSPFANQIATAGRIQLNAVKAFVHRDSKGNLTAIESWHTIQKDMLAGSRTDGATSDASAKKKSGAFKFRIGRAEISDGSEIQIKDDSVSPAFTMDLSILQARVTELDSSRPKQPASIKLLLSDKENARLSLDGTMIPFADKTSLDWIGKIEALELPSLSPYAIQNTGYLFSSGELQADVPVKSDREAVSKGTPTTASQRPTDPAGDNADKDKILSQKEPAASKITDAALVKLAKNRSDRIEDQRVKLHGIAGNRIIDCTPEIDRSAAAEPRADLEI